MRRLSKNKQAQSILEIAILSVCVIIAFLVMQGYIKRGYSGRLKQATDSGLGTQFDPVDGTYEKTSYQNGQVDYGIYYAQGRDMGLMNGSMRDQVFPVSVQTMGPSAIGVTFTNFNGTSVPLPLIRYNANRTGVSATTTESSTIASKRLEVK